jgi:catalase
MTDIERDHIVEAFTFELGKCYEQPIRERQLVVLAQVAADLCERVAAGLGMPAPAPSAAPAEVTPSPALSQVPLTPGPIAGRVVGVVAGPGADLAGIAQLRDALAAEQAVLRVIAPIGGTLGTGKRTELVERTLLTTRSIEFDAVLIADGTAGLRDVKLSVLLQEAFRHCKALGAWGDGAQVLLDAGIDTAAPGVLVADNVGETLTSGLIASLGLHRVWARAELVMASH